MTHFAMIFNAIDIVYTHDWHVARSGGARTEFYFSDGKFETKDIDTTDLRIFYHLDKLDPRAIIGMTHGKYQSLTGSLQKKCLMSHTHDHHREESVKL
jgi:hypothetical protein